MHVLTWLRYEQAWKLELKGKCSADLWMPESAPTTELRSPEFFDLDFQSCTVRTRGTFYVCIVPVIAGFLISNHPGYRHL